MVISAVALSLGAICLMLAPARASDNAFSTYYQFGMPGNTGYSNPTNLILGNDGNLYGVFGQGAGGSLQGAIFELTTGTTTLSIVYAFGPQSLRPNQLAEGPDGSFFGFYLKSFAPFQYNQELYQYNPNSGLKELDELGVQGRGTSPAWDNGGPAWVCVRDVLRLLPAWRAGICLASAAWRWKLQEARWAAES